MSLLTPERTVQLIKNGHTPEADHFPVVYIQTPFADEVIGGFLLTHIEPEHGKEAYGLIEFGHGITRMSIVFLDKLKTSYPQYEYKIETHLDISPN